MPDTDPRARYRTQHKSIGTITPSGNIVVERMTTAILEAFATTSVRRFGLVTPYAPAYASRIPPHFQAQGYACVAQAHAGLSDNLSYCTITDADIAAMVRTVAAERPDAVILCCTNFPGRTWWLSWRQ